MHTTFYLSVFCILLQSGHSRERSHSASCSYRYWRCLCARGARCLLLLLLVFTPAVEADEAQTNTYLFVLNENHYPGSMVTAVVHQERALSGMRVSLYTDQDEIVASATGFMLELNSGKSAWVALLGVHSYIPAGDYFLRADVWGFFYTNEHTYPLQISPRKFALDRIALNQELTDMRSSLDVRKEHETREILETFATTNTDTLYHPDALVKPITSNRVTSGYGDRRTFAYADGDEEHGIHNGIDWGEPTGTQVVAAASGRVVMVKSRIITGNSVVIEHLPGVYTTYYHLDTTAVRVGDTVNVGQLVGALGSTGLSTGPHLHWELRASVAAIDPIPFFSEPLLDTTRIDEILSKQYE